MKDVKTISVPTSREAATIRLYQCFGWTLLNNQEVYSQDSHLERGTLDNKLYNVTRTVHYAKLTFERDPQKLKHYNQVRQLENEFNAVPAPPKKPRLMNKKEMTMAIGGLGFIVLLFLIMSEFVGALLFAAAIGGVFLYQKSTQKKLAAWQVVNQEYLKKRELILQKADRLCRS